MNEIIWPQRTIGGIKRRGRNRCNNVSGHTLRSAIFWSHRLTIKQFLNSYDPMLRLVGIWRRDKSELWKILLQTVGIDVVIYRKNCGSIDNNV